MYSTKKFGKCLVFHRKQKNLSQETLARKTGLSRNFIGLLEGGQRLPSLTTTLKVMQVLGLKELRDFFKIS